MIAPVPTTPRRPLPSLADAAAAWVSLLRARACHDRPITLTPAQVLDLAVTLERLTQPAVWELREQLADELRQTLADFDAGRLDDRALVAALDRAHGRLAEAVRG